jgi:hypothetical protein
MINGLADSQTRESQRRECAKEPNRSYLAHTGHLQALPSPVILRLFDSI